MDSTSISVSLTSSDNSQILNVLRLNSFDLKDTLKATSGFSEEDLMEDQACSQLPIKPLVSFKVSPTFSNAFDDFDLPSQEVSFGMAKLDSSTPKVLPTGYVTHSHKHRAKRRKLESQSDHQIPQIHIRPDMIKKYGTLKVDEISYNAFKLAHSENGWIGRSVPTSETEHIKKLNEYKYIPADRYDLEVYMVYLNATNSLLALIQVS